MIFMLVIASLVMKNAPTFCSGWYRLWFWRSDKAASTGSVLAKTTTDRQTNKQPHHHQCTANIVGGQRSAMNQHSSRGETKTWMMFLPDKQHRPFLHEKRMIKLKVEKLFDRPKAVQLCGGGSNKKIHDEIIVVTLMNELTLFLWRRQSTIRGRLVERELVMSSRTSPLSSSSAWIGF